MKEKWQPITDFPPYSISSLGRLKKGGRGKPLKFRKGKKSYPVYDFIVDGLKTAKRIDELVLEAFKTKPEESASFPIHLDKNIQNNALANLKWGTAKQASLHNLEGGSKFKLTDDQVLEILELRGVKSTREIAKIFEVSHATVANIFAGESWKKLQTTENENEN